MGLRDSEACLSGLRCHVRLSDKTKTILSVEPSNTSQLSSVFILSGDPDHSHHHRAAQIVRNINLNQGLWVR